MAATISTVKFMPKKKTRPLRKSKRRKLKREALAQTINDLIAPFNCKFVGFGANAVGVQGDARSYGVSAIVRFPADAPYMEIGEVSNLITNRVREVTRVLMDIDDRQNGALDM